MTRQTYRKTSSEKQNGLLKVQDPFDGYRCFQKNKTSLSFLLLLWVFLLLHLIVFLVEFRKKTMSRLRRKEATLHTRFLLISLPLHFFLDFYSPNFSSSSHWEKGQNSPPPSWYHYLILNFWKIEKRTYVLTFSPKVCATVLNPANYMIMKYFQEEKKKKKSVKTLCTHGACCTLRGVAPKISERSHCCKSFCFPVKAAHFGGEGEDVRISFSWRQASARVFFLLHRKHLARRMQKPGLA